MESNPNESNETNPYLVIVSRKVRNLKKKLDKIKTYESKPVASLNEEQVAVVASKASVEKSLAALESVRLQILEIASELAITNPKPVVVESGSNTNEVPAVIAESTQVEIPQVSEIGTQSDQETVAPAPSAVLPTTTVTSEIKIDSVQEALQKLFTALHVCSLYMERTGKGLPENVDFFGKNLLGYTSILGFRDTVEKSIQAALLYLNDDIGKDHEVIRGVSYYDMSMIIDDLACELEGGSRTVQVPEPNYYAPFSPAPATTTIQEVSLSQPNIDFYYDSAPDNNYDGNLTVAHESSISLEASKITEYVLVGSQESNNENKKFKKHNNRNRSRATSNVSENSAKENNNSSGHVLPASEGSLASKDQKTFHLNDRTKSPKNATTTSTEDTEVAGKENNSGGENKRESRNSRKYKNGQATNPSVVDGHKTSDGGASTSEVKVTFDESNTKPADPTVRANAWGTRKAQISSDVQVSQEGSSVATPRNRGSYRHTFHDRSPRLPAENGLGSENSERKPHNEQRPYRPRNNYDNRKNEPNSASSRDVAPSSSSAGTAVPPQMNDKTAPRSTDPSKPGRGMHSPRTFIAKQSESTNPSTSAPSYRQPSGHAGREHHHGNNARPSAPLRHTQPPPTAP